MTHQRPKTDGVVVWCEPDYLPVGTTPIGITDLTDSATKSMTDPSMEELARQIQTHLTAEQIYLGNAKAERLRANDLKARLDEKFEAEIKRVTGEQS